jgi:alanine racemase
MDSRKRQGLLESHTTRQAGALTSLYEVGPLRLQRRSLKTVRAYVSRANLRHNVGELKKYCGKNVMLWPVVKADGYGHQSRIVVSCLNDQVEGFVVSTVEEAEQIYPFIGGKVILITCPLFTGMDQQLIRLAQVRGFHCTICSLEALRYAGRFLRAAEPQLNVHLKIDTGMGRIGCRGEDEQLLLQAVAQNNKLHLRGVYTHFATADDDDLTYAYEQLKVFQEFLVRSGLDRQESIIKHACNTSAAIRIPDAHYDMVRCGIGLYGYRNCGAELSKPLDLRGVLRIEAPLVQVKAIRAGQSCGYGRSFIAQRDMVIGIIPMGYADGLFRNLSNRAVMRLGQYDLPVIGRICMDFTIIDLSKLADPAEGMMVTVIDDDKTSSCNIASLAKLAGTVPYEMFTAIGNRIKRELV